MRTAVKLSDLAVIAGVSTSTVSRALSGHSSVNEKTRERIQALADEHSVRPNLLARNLRKRSTGAIGLALPLGHAKSQHLTDPFFLSMLGFLTDLLTERGYDILLSRVTPTDGMWLERMIDGGKFDGLLLIGQSDQYDTIERTAATYGPLVVWGTHREGQRHLAIGSDNFAGGSMVADHLVETGRSRLLFVGDSRLPEFGQRLSGFAAAAQTHGIDVMTLETSMTPDAVYQAMSERLRNGPIPTGIFAASDVVAMSVLRSLTDAGLNVPSDVGVVGYDDVTLASHTTPPLTTIRQDLMMGATLMVDRLLSLVAGEAATAAIVPPVLIKRGSS